MENRYCPLMGKDIDIATCFDIHMVVEGMAPDRTAPKEAVSHPKRNEMCMNCKFHRTD